MGVKIRDAGFASPATSSAQSSLIGPSVSVAVCTRDRPDLLRRTLRSLVRQSETPREILVVDNAPTSDLTRRLMTDEFPQIRYLLERRQGLDFARNRALSEAAGEIVAFLDDDAVADPGWLTHIRRPFAENERTALCTGRVEAWTVASAGQALFEANGGFGRGMERLRLPADSRRRLHGFPAPLIAWAVSIGSGNSYAVRRSLALRLGGFDEALDLGEALPGGGDHDLLWRMLQAGYEVTYEPEALAWHDHRPKEADAVRQIAGHQKALIAMLVKSAIQARGRTRWSVFAFLVWRLTKPGIRLARRAIGRDPLPASALVHVWWQCLLGIGAYFSARRIAHRRAAPAGSY